MPLKKAVDPPKAPRTTRQRAQPSTRRGKAKPTAARPPSGDAEATGPSASPSAAHAKSSSGAAPSKGGRIENDLVAYQERVEKVMSIARALFEARIDWPSYFREVLGLTGIVQRVFQDKDERALFVASEEHAEIHKYFALLVKHRELAGEEPTRVITVRLPSSLHAWLKTEAHRREVSLNDLCINRLLLEDALPVRSGTNE